MTDTTEKPVQADINDVLDNFTKRSCQDETNRIKEIDYGR